MTEFSERLLDDAPRKKGASRFQLPFFLFIPTIAILFQVYVPRFFPQLRFLEFPLLVTVYFALMKRQAIPGLFFGAGVGLLQDCLANYPIGLFGIVKTLVGYFAASVSLRFDVENHIIRVILGFFFYCFHQFFYWVLTRALLGEPTQFKLDETAIFGGLNAIVALPLFVLLDKLKE